MPKHPNYTIEFMRAYQVLALIVRLYLCVLNILAKGETSVTIDFDDERRTTLCKTKHTFV